MWSGDINTEVHLRNEPNAYKTHLLLHSKQTKNWFLLENFKSPFQYVSLNSAVSIGNLAPNNDLVKTNWSYSHLWTGQKEMSFTKKDTMKPKVLFANNHKNYHSLSSWAGAYVLSSFNADNSVGEDCSCSYLRDEKIKAHRKVKMNCTRSDS